jgi:hypothetical protein
VRIFLFACLLPRFFSVCCLFSLVDSRLSFCLASVPGIPNQWTPFPEEPFVSPSYGNVGPPYISTLTLPGFTIGLQIWLFSTPVIPKDPSDLYASHHDLLPPCLPPCLVKLLVLVTREIRRRRNKILRRRRNTRLRRRKIRKGPSFQPL